MFLSIIHKKYPEIYILLENGSFDIILDVFLAIASKSAQKWDFKHLYQAGDFFEKLHFLKRIEPCLHPLDATLDAPSLNNDTLSLPVLDKDPYGLKVLAVINSKVEQAFDCS